MNPGSFNINTITGGLYTWLCLGSRLFFISRNWHMLMRWSKFKSKTCGNPKRFDSGIRKLEQFVEY